MAQDTDSENEDLHIPISGRGTPESAVVEHGASSSSRNHGHLSPGSPRPGITITNILKPKEKSPSPGPGHLTLPQNASNADATNERFNPPAALTGMSRFNFLRRRRMRNASIAPQPWREWEKAGREPYHAYVHSLVEAGWGNLKNLDDYMGSDIEDPGLVVSVLDIHDDGNAQLHEDMHSETDLAHFLQENVKSKGRNVRLYMVEQEGGLASGIIEAFGCALKLDPRFFAWHVFGSTRVLEPSQRHRAPYTSLGFTILSRCKSERSTDTDFFRVSIYLKADEGGGDGWTGILLFSSHAKLALAMNQLRNPPEFGSPIPPPAPIVEKSFRELYLSTFSFIDLREAALSPLYCLQYLFKLNGHCWNAVLNAIRAEDRRIDGISEASVSHVEDIRKTLALIQRGISSSWPRCDTGLSKDAKAALEEDFKHVLNQADLLWETRDKMASIRHKKRDTRISTLTNAFTYIFAPVSLVTGIYGMNVQQINGSPPGIWQFFVATATLIALMLLAFMATGFVHIQKIQKRRAGFWETVKFAVGKKY